MRSSGAADLRLKAYRHDDLVFGVFEELVFGPNFQIFPNPVCGLSPAGSILLVPISTPSQGVTSFFPAA